MKRQYSPACIVAGGFEGLPEEGLLRRAVRGLCDLHVVEISGVLPRYVARTRPAIVVLPTADAQGVSLAAITDRCAELAPDVPRIVLVTRQGASGRAIPEACRIDAAVACIASVADLRDILSPVLGPSSLTRAELSQIKLMLVGVPHRPLRKALTVAAVWAHEHLTVAGLATRLRIDRRTLSRLTYEEDHLTPRHLVLWGRLIRVGAVSWRRHATLRALARSSGFPSDAALEHAIDEFFGRRLVRPQDLSAALVASELRRYLQPSPRRRSEH